MYLYKNIRVKLNERVVIFRHGLPLRALAPGRHRIWGTRLTEQRFDVSHLLLRALPEVRAVLPGDWFAEVTIADDARGVLYRDGAPVRFLRPGVHRYWTLDPSVELKVLSITEPMPKLSDELVGVIPPNEYVYTVVREHERGLHYVQGRLAGVLSPGRYALWTHPEAEVDVKAIDMRRAQVALAGQELMTRDKVTLRLSLSVEYAVEDPATMVHTVDNPRDAVYLLVQLAAREYLAGVTLDELLEGRDAMTRFLEEQTVPKAARFGVRIERVGVKDVVLPGEMKALLNRVIEAEKEAAANVILRREETAATRSLANTARVMADNPVLLRLKELDAMKDIAGSIHEVRMVVGSDGLDTLLSAQLLGDGKAKA
ncbi:MAG: slipin family protein [Myxococcales bacterium]|nr:slipin family protein [Myxococcales bacterium]